jgi:hypothetical protein
VDQQALAEAESGFIRPMLGAWGAPPHIVHLVLRINSQFFRHRVAESIKESREQLAKAIEEWARVASLEQFFSGVQNRAQDLPEEQRQEVLERLALAREFVGTGPAGILPRMEDTR